MLVWLVGVALGVFPLGCAYCAGRAENDDSVDQSTTNALSFFAVAAFIMSVICLS